MSKASVTLFEKMYFAVGPFCRSARALLRLNRKQVHRATGVWPATVDKIERMDPADPSSLENLTFKPIQALLSFYAAQGVTMHPVTFEMKINRQRLEAARERHQLELGKFLTRNPLPPVPPPGSEPKRGDRRAVPPEPTPSD